MTKPSTPQTPETGGADVVTFMEAAGARVLASFRDDAGGLVLASFCGADLLVGLCNEEHEVGFGDGLELALARAAGDQADTAPEWIQLLPAGPTITARDGRTWTLPDPEVVLAHFTANGADLPVDLEHASELLAPKGHAAPAQGWIKALAIRDGAVWGQVDWTDEGSDQVTSKRYRYVSPAILHDKAGAIRGLSSAGLVTRPALHMPALARHGGRNSTHNQDQNMKTLAERLREAFSLGADATDDAIVTAATAQVALARDARDPEKFVPAADLQTALARATTAETKLKERDDADKETAAVAAVDGAIAEGKIAPASREHWLSIARENGEAFAKAVAAMPAVLTPTDTGKKPGDAQKGALTDDQKALCRDLGVTEEAFAKNLKEQA